MQQSFQKLRVDASDAGLQPHHIQAVETIRPLCWTGRAFFFGGGEGEMLRTSAALAAAAFGLDDSSGTCGFLPNVRPPLGPLILGGADARAPST